MKETNFVKKVRARAKTRYYKNKKSECFICKATKKLELHHILPLAEIVKNYLKTNDVGGKTDEELVTEILENCPEIFDENNVVTLCKQCHYWLHNLFGASYSTKVAKNVQNYLIKKQEQRRKTHG